MITQFLSDHFFMLWLIILAWVVLFSAYQLIKRKKRGSIFPDISTQMVLHKESFASGQALDRKNNGAASNCLVVIVTDKEVWTTTYFPFTVLVEMFGLENRIKKEDIINIQQEKKNFGNSIIIKFKDEKLNVNRFRISSKKPESLINALNQVSKVKTPE